MSVDWGAVATIITSGAAVAGGIAWAAKATISHFLNVDLEGYKNNLKYESDLALEARRNRLRRKVAKRRSLTKSTETVAASLFG